MPFNRSFILPGVYALLALAGYWLATWGYEFALSRPADGAFAPAFWINFLGILRVVLPVFFAVMALFSLFDRGIWRRRGRSRAAAPPVRNRPVLPRGSEVVDLNYGLVRRMEWRRFEVVCAEYLRCWNFEVLETGFGAKDAVDLEVFVPGKSEVLSVVKCVAAGRRVEASDVREMVAAMKRRRVAEGMIFCALGCSRRTARFAARHRIALVDGETLCARVRALEPARRKAMIKIATEGDYSTPTCPSCGIKMVLRRRARARPGRGEFWGCINFPRCRRTIPFT